MKRSAVFVLFSIMSLALAGCVAPSSGRATSPKVSPTPATAADATADTGDASNDAGDASSNAKTNNDATAKDGSKSKAARTTSLLVHPVDALEVGYSVRWATSISVRPKEKLAHVAVLGDMIVTAEHPANVISAVALDNGKLLWRVAIGSPIDITYKPVRVDNKILVNTETQLYVLNAEDGKFITRANLRSPVRNGPTTIGEYAIFGGADGMVFGHDTRVGFEKWSYNLQTQILIPPVAVNSQVFVGTANGRYASFAGREGEVLWQGRTFGAISATPTVNNLGIFIACEDGNLYSVNRSTGEDRWIYRYTDALKESPIALKNAVYLPLPSGELLALRATNGTEIWTLKTSSRPIAQTSRGLIFVDNGKIEIRDPASGKVIANAVTKKLQEVIPVGASTLLLVASDGKMMRIDVN